MKKILIIIALIFFGSSMMPCDTVSASTKAFPVPAPGKYKVYCEITYMPYQRVAIVNIGSTVDAIRDDAGNPKEFISILDAINYMARFGWEIAEIYGVPKGNDKESYYFLSKEVSNENEIGKGLNLKPIDQNFFKNVH